MTISRRVGIVGAGAVGGLIAAQLLQGDPDLQVTLIGRRDVVDVINQRGLQLIRGGERVTVEPRATTVETGSGPFDLVISCVRAFDLAASVPDLVRLAGSDGLVMGMQNGVDNDVTLIDAFGPERILAGTTTISVSVESPGTVRQNSRSGGFALAAVGDRMPPHWLAAALGASIVADYRALRWSKLLLNLLGAATTAILDVPLDRVVANPRLFRVEQLASREASRVMSAQGITARGLPGYPVPLLRALLRLPLPLARTVLAPRLARSRGGRSPASRQDLARGRSEIPWLNGAVAQTAGRVGVPAPLNNALAELVQALLADVALRESYRRDPHRLLSFLRARGVRHLRV